MPWRTVLFLLAGVAFLGYAALGESQRWLPWASPCPRPAWARWPCCWPSSPARTARGSAPDCWCSRSSTRSSRPDALTQCHRVGLACHRDRPAHLPAASVHRPGRALGLDSDLGVTIVDSVVAVGLVVALAWLAHRMRAMSFAGRRVVGAASWVFGLVVATTGVVAAGVLVGRAMDAAPAGFRAGHALATILWMVAAAWLLILGLRRARTPTSPSGSASGWQRQPWPKLFVYDLAVLAGIWRVVAFIVVGLCSWRPGPVCQALDRAPQVGGPWRHRQCRRQPRSTRSARATRTPLSTGSRSPATSPIGDRRCHRATGSGSDGRTPRSPERLEHVLPGPVGPRRRRGAPARRGATARQS